jgi:hypothetical protein
MKKLSLALVIGFSLVLIAGGAFAASDSKPLTVNVTVSDAVSLTISQAAITFPSANPGTTPSISNSEGDVTITANARTGASSSVTLTHLASGPLTGSAGTIPISNVSWTVPEAEFASGSMSSSSVSVGTWQGSGTHVGTFSYHFANSWNYAVGTYAATSTYTLTAP